MKHVVIVYHVYQLPIAKQYIVVQVLLEACQAHVHRQQGSVQFYPFIC